MKKLLAIAIVICAVPLVAMKEPTKKQQKAVKKEEKQQPPKNKKCSPTSDEACEWRRELWGELHGIK